MQLNLGSNGSYAFPDLMRNTPGDLKGERQQSHVTRGVCNAMPMRREGPWRDSGRKKEPSANLFLSKCCYLWWTKVTLDLYVMYMYIVSLWKFISSLRYSHDLLVMTCWYTLYNWLPLKHAYRTAGTLHKKSESGIFGTHFQKMQNSQIP
jgi:hypothetical protein